MTGTVDKILWVYSILFWIFNALATWTLLRYHLHMFQLNGYKHSEEKAWLKKNAWENLGRILGILISFLLPFPFAIIFFIWTAYGNRTFEARVKFSYTKRVIRLLAGLVLLYLIMTGAVFAFGRLIPPVMFKNYFFQIFYQMLFSLFAVFVPQMILFVDYLNRPLEKRISNWYVEDAKKKLAASNCRVIGITGSYGKTGFKYILDVLLSAKYNVLKTPGNYNTTMGVTRTIRERLTPLHEIFICEMGARYVGDIKEICDLVKPEIGVITSIGEQHLESFGSIDNIKKTKFELFDATETSYLNISSDRLREQFEKLTTSDKTLSNRKVTLYGEGQYYVPEILSVSTNGMKFKTTFKDGKEYIFETELIGRHQAINICGALAVAFDLGVPANVLIRQVKRLAPVEHRLQISKQPYGMLIDDAYNSNPVGAKAALEVLKMTEGYKILITPGMVELGEKHYEVNYKFGEEATEAADMIICVNDNSNPIYQAVKDKKFKNCKKVFALKEAMELALNADTDKQKIILIENDLPDHYR